MTSLPSTPEPRPERLPDQMAARLLERASEIDATGQSGTTVAELRHAAQAAGISAQAFDAALAEMQQTQPSAPVRTEPPASRAARLWRVAGFNALLLAVPLVGLMAVRAFRSPVVASTDGLVDASITLTCLSADDASERLRALVLDEARKGNRDGGMRISFTSRAPTVVRVHATPAWVSLMRSKIAELENAPGTVCTLPGGNTPSP